MILCLNRHTQSAQHPHNPRWQHQAALQGRPQGTVRSLSPLRPSHPRQRSKGTAGTHRATQGNSSSQQPHKGNGARQVCRPGNAGAHRHTRTQGHTGRARTATPTLRAPAGAHRRRRARAHGHARSGSERRRRVRRKRKRRSRRKRKGERRGVPQLPGRSGRSLGCFGGPGSAVRLGSAPFGPVRPAGKRGSHREPRARAVTPATRRAGKAGTTGHGHTPTYSPSALFTGGTPTGCRPPPVTAARPGKLGGSRGSRCARSCRSLELPPSGVRRPCQRKDERNAQGETHVSLPC